MVTYKNESAYSGTPNLAGNRKINATHPLYPLTEVRAAIGANAAILLGTDGAKNDATDLMLDASSIIMIFKSLNPKNYRDSEWCELSKYPGQPNGLVRVAACDAYNFKPISEKLSKILDKKKKYFIKFALNSQKDMLIVSIHANT